jgi:hypothetical protein
MALDNYNKARKKKKSLAILNEHKIDIVFAIFCIFLVYGYTYYISLMKVPIHDGAYYLLNAHDWLTNNPLSEFYRPPLISWIIAGVWSITGESWVVVKGLQAAFTVSAGIILYLVLRKHKGAFLVPRLGPKDYRYSLLVLLYIFLKVKKKAIGF